MRWILLGCRVGLWLSLVARAIRGLLDKKASGGRLQDTGRCGYLCAIRHETHETARIGPAKFRQSPVELHHPLAMIWPTGKGVENASS